jgi:Zn-dependent protease
MSWEDRDYASFDPTRRPDGFGAMGRGGSSRFADNPLNWSPTIGHLFNIRIRIHILFIAVIAFRLIGAGGHFVFTLTSLAILFGSVLLHEFGHCFAARSVGGSADDILMWPLGGLASVDAPRRPWPQFVTVVCGPLVNVALFGVSSAILLISGASISINSINPFDWLVLPFVSISDPRFWLWIVFSINTMLFLFNLLPMYPMDGGRMLQCALWSKMDYRRATLITTTIGMVAALLLGLYALTSSQWILIGIAIFGYITCYQERALTKAGMAMEEGFMGHDFSGGYSTLEKDEKPKRPGMFARWKQNKQEGRWRAARQAEAELQEKVDAILDKVKRDGINSLSKREKQLLESATNRQKAEGRRHGV